MVIPELSTNHEEVYTKVAYLAQHAIDTYSAIEIVTCSRSGDVCIPVLLTRAFGSSSTLIVVGNGSLQVSFLEAQKSLLNYSHYVQNFFFILMNHCIDPSIDL